MWHNYCVRGKWGHTNQPANRHRNIKQSWDQLSTHLACGWLVKRKNPCWGLSYWWPKNSTLHVLSQLLHRVGMDTVHVSGQDQPPSLWKAKPPLCTRLATSLCFQRNLTHSISCNPNPNSNYYLDQSGTSCTCYS